MAPARTIIKRNGSTVPFDPAKVQTALSKAGAATGEFDAKEAQRLADIAVGIVHKVVEAKNQTPTVEQLQDTVEQVLMAAGHFQTAKAYILYRAEHSKVRSVAEELGVENDLNLSINQLKVIERRYLQHDENGKPTETPGKLFRRVARTLAKVEKKSKQAKWEEQFFEVMSKFEFLPGGRTLNNAGTAQNQLANCFVLPVEDSMEGIFDAVKWTAMVHQKGGGCIAKGSKVFTTFCGLENFEVLYDRLGGAKAEKKDGSGWSIDVRSKKIKTLALDAATGDYVHDDIQKIWRYELPADRIYTIKAQGNLEVTTSDWHPFFVFEDGQIQEKRADAIQKGDLLVAGNPSIVEQWPFTSYKALGEYALNEDLAWLVGYLLGDGSISTIKSGVKKRPTSLRLRLFDGRQENLQKVSRILSSLTGKHYAVQQDSRSKTKIVTVTDQALVKTLSEFTQIDGPKGSALHMPADLIKSPLSVVCAALAGLIDSDGHITKNKNRMEFSTESQELADQVASLFGLLGIQAGVRSRKPVNKSWKLMYEVRLDGVLSMQGLLAYIQPYMVDVFKTARIMEHAMSEREIKSMSSPTSFTDLEQYLVKAGIQTKRAGIHRKAQKIGAYTIWLHRLKQGNSISTAGVVKIITALLTTEAFSAKERITLERMRNLNLSLRLVKTISRPKVGGDFYDFTTSKHHNYLAGKHGLTAVHNTGFDFSQLRPRGDVITKSSGGFATGPVSFMKVFDTATRQVMQGGKQRGANMGILAAHHPDILEFITCKSEEGEISNFNISLGITDTFMRAVEKDADFALKNPRTGETVQNVSARLLMDQIIGLAWRTGDPGMIYWDAINRNNPLRESVGPIYATNPCGEQPLHPFDSCNLGSLNLSAFVQDKKDGKSKEINYERLQKVTKIAVRLLDNVIDACTYPLPQITHTVKQNRRIGLGVMGWADVLFKLGVGYNTNEGVKLAEKVMSCVQQASWEASEELAREKGAFPQCKNSWFGKGFDPVTKKYDHREKPKKYRNVAITTIAPTGTISMAAECSSGIEPVFALSYVKNVVDSNGLVYVQPLFESALKAAVGEGEQYNSLIQQVATHGSAQHVDGMPEVLKRVFVTSHDISWEWHVKMQAAFQKYTDNAVSKTINFPSEASMDDIRQAYLLSWKLGCKGITVYRDKSKNVQVLSAGSGSGDGISQPSELAKSSSAKSAKSESKKKGNEQIMQSKLRHVPLNQRTDFAALIAQEVRNADVYDAENEAEKCPECSTTLIKQEGCNLCPNCGWSKCKL